MNFDDLLEKYEPWLAAGRYEELLKIVKDQIDWSDFEPEQRSAVQIELVNELTKRYIIRSMDVMFGGAVDTMNSVESTISDEYEDEAIPEARSIEFLKN